MSANTTIELKCNWDGDFELIEPDGTLITYKREEWHEVQNHLFSLVRAPAGDPK
jgi:hypothetical protein